MKKITLVMALLSAITLFGQKQIPAKVQQLIANKTVFRPVAPLKVSKGAYNGIDAAVSNATYAALDAEVIRDVALKKYPALELTFPYDGAVVTLLLYRVEILANGFHIDTDKQANIGYTPGAYYRGIIKGDVKSVASFNFFDKEMNGIASSSKFQNLVVGRLKDPKDFSNYIIYSDKDLKGTNNFSCAVADAKELPTFNPHGRSTTETLSTRCATVYFEIDHELFITNGGDTTITGNWMTSVFNNVQTLFANDNISTALKSFYIWTEPDPYSGESSSDYLMQFYSQRPVFDGDVGQLIGTDDGGLGGVAASVGGFCSDTNVSYSDVYIWFDEVPVFSWTVQVITHELGHVYGSPHTHGCYWNGNNTAIDGCGTMAGYEEGDCEIGPVPEEWEGGTIMSYCHLLDGVGINFANGFGSQPAERIINTIESSLCLSTDCINTCINNITLMDVIDVADSSITISWLDESPGSDGPWEVGYARGNAAITNWQQVDEPLFTATGLTENTYYRFTVKPLCNEEQEAEVRTITTATAADWCSGITWRDTGNNNNYPNNQHLIRIMKPGENGQHISVMFTSFQTEEEYDVMYVYDGIGIQAPLIESYSGFTVPEPIAATNSAGALTFEFISDTYINYSGWNATVNCTLGTGQNAFSNLSYYPNPVGDAITLSATEGITEVKIYNMAGQLLSRKPVNNTSTIINMAAYAPGIYLFRVINGDKTASLKIAKQ